MLKSFGQGGRRRAGWTNRARPQPSASTRRLRAVVLVAFGALMLSASSASAVQRVTPSLVQTIDTSLFNPSSPDPSGIAYRPARDRFVISDSEVEETSLYQGFNLFTSTRLGLGIGSGTVMPGSPEPTDLGYNEKNAALFVSDDAKHRVTIIKPGPDGNHGTDDDIVSRFSTLPFSIDPEGVVYDNATGHLFVADGEGIEIYRVNPVNGVFGDGNDVVTHFDLARHGVRDCHGLGIDPHRDRLLCVDPSTPDNIYEVGKGGRLFRILSMAANPTLKAVLADVTMAPTSDPTDGPGKLSYWIVDRHLDNGNYPDENDGLLYEMR